MITELSLWILDYLDSHLYEEINIDTLSSFIGYDKSYIMKRFKKDVGVSIKTYLNQKKIINSLK
ncbi:MAG TPA: helix-turn-helix transcriptional regulator, partial [Candidatus Coprovivens excrementavium]|nr:helix-turn-helix transcriptional regulator [Candidatus Coprovivens excrementavium]